MTRAIPNNSLFSSARIIESSHAQSYYIRYDQIQRMNCQYLMYKRFRVDTPYEEYIKLKKVSEETKEKIKFHNQILKFRESRYPRQLMMQLQREINPFELTLEKLKEFYNHKFSQYPNELVHEAVEFVFKRKYEESQMLKSSSLVIEDGPQKIRNGRKLQKEDFSFNYSKIQFQPGDTSRSRDKHKEETSINTADLNSSRKRSQGKDNAEPSNVFSKMQAKTERFNEMLMEEIKREKNQYDSIPLIQEQNPDDSLFFENPTSRREKTSDSFPRFREQDLIVQPEGMETGRTDAEELNILLAGLGQKQEEEGDFTGRSRASKYQMKINPEVMGNLYNARGKIKLNLVKRICDKINKEQY